MDFDFIQMTMKPISPLSLIGTGLILVFLEMVFTSFFLVFFGISAIIIGFLSFIVHFENGYYQIILFSLLTVANFIFLKKTLKDNFLKPAEEFKENVLNESGTGIIKNNRVNFKGTQWVFKVDETSEAKLEDFEENETVNVLRIEHNKAIISKK